MTSARRPSAVLLLALALAAVVATAPEPRAADVRVAYIDSARIFQEYRLAKEAQEQFERKVQGWRAEAAEKDKVVAQLKQELRDQGPVLSSLKRQEKEEALQRAIADAERFTQEIWGPNGKAAQENERATQEVVQQIRSVVEKIASEDGLDLVLDAASGQIIYARKTLDLTDRVLQELDKLAPAATPK